MKKTIIGCVLFLMMSMLACENDKTSEVNEIVVLTNDVLLSIGKSDTILATSYPSDVKLSWKSESPSIASVDQQGIVTGISPGSTNVTVEYDNLSERISVEVFEPLTDIIITPSESTFDLTIEFGVPRTLQLTATPVPVQSSEPFFWKTSNPDVCTVSKTGLVTPTGAGSTILTVEGREGVITKIITVNVKTLGGNVVQFNSKLFKRSILPGDNYLDKSVWWYIESIWDGTESAGGSSCSLPGPQSFTFDMGVTGNLSYFHLYTWESSGEGYPPFVEGCPKKFEVWGCETLDPSGSWDTWTKLMDCEVIKPSGLPEHEVNDADWEAFLSGQKFFNRDNYTTRVRYIRVKILETFGGIPCWRIKEIKLYGEQL